MFSVQDLAYNSFTNRTFGASSAFMPIYPNTVQQLSTASYSHGPPKSKS